MPVKWETLITDGKGRVSLHRLRKFLSLLFGCIGAVAIVTGMFVEIVISVSGSQADMKTQVMLIGGAILVGPMTGGAIGDAIYARSASARIKQGGAPGRRVSDNSMTVPTLPGDRD
jgi:hypothetical protein